MRLTKQIGILLLVAGIFATFDLSVYQVFTKRYINHTSEGMQAKSIELDKYLPFDENSMIVKLDSETKLSGELPVIDGAAALYPVFSSFVDAVYPEDSVQFDGDNFLPGSALQYTNTRGAYRAIVDGSADVIFCAAPSEEQLAYAEEQGVSLEFVPVGNEAFVFLVNSSNPVESLTTDQIRAIYAGEITNWSEVGGDNAPIDALQRNQGSGSQTAMLSFMGDTEMHRKPFAFMGKPIGYSFRYYVEGIVENGAVKMLALNGVYPDKEHVADGSYPIVAQFYAVYRTDDPNPNIPVLLDFILSEEGQCIVEDSGYVPLDQSR